MNIWHRIDELKVWKKKSFCVTMAVIVLMALLCLIKIAMPCGEWEYECEGGPAYAEGGSDGEMTVCGGICLKPGVYRIELAYHTDTDLVAMCNVTDGTVFYKGLLSNGEHMYSGLRRTGYDMWLYESTEDLRIVVPYGGEGNLEIGSVRIIETNQLWTMLLSMVLCIGIILCALQIFYYYDNHFHVSLYKKQVFFWIMVISFIASIPYLCGYTLTGADLTYHLQRIEGVKDGLLGGQFPVRLEPRWVYDHGYANAVFYCNSLLYLPALFRLLGFPVMTSYNIYCIVLNIATAWISYYCFGRIFKKSSIGIVCSALYTLSVFRIYKLILMTAVGEGTAVTFIPLVLYGLYRILADYPEEEDYKSAKVPLKRIENYIFLQKVEGYKSAWAPLAIGLSGLIQSHVLTCEITAMVMLLFCIIYVRKIFRRKVLWELLKCAIVTVGVNLWFLVPFLDYYLTQDMHIKNVSARTIQDRGLHIMQLPFYFRHMEEILPGEENLIQNAHPVGVGPVLCVALGVFLLLWMTGRLGKQDRKKLSAAEKNYCRKTSAFTGMTFFVKTAVFIGMLLMCMSLEVFPWDRIQETNSVMAALVSSLQFPNRFLGWGTGCLVLVFGFCAWYFAEYGREVWFRFMMGAAVLGILISNMYILDRVNGEQEYFELYNEEGMGFGYISGAEYLLEGTDWEKLTFADAVAGQGVEIRDYRKEYLRATLQCVNMARFDSYAEFPMLWYKGYRAVCVETGQKMQIGAGENNVIRVLLPEGFEGTVQVDFVSPVYWRISELASVLTLMALAVRRWNMGQKDASEIMKIKRNRNEN